MSRDLTKSFRGADEVREPGIHSHHREYGFRLSLRSAGMTGVGV